MNRLTRQGLGGKKNRFWRKHRRTGTGLTAELKKRSRGSGDDEWRSEGYRHRTVEAQNPITGITRERGLEGLSSVLLRRLRSLLKMKPWKYLNKRKGRFDSAGRCHCRGERYYHAEAISDESERQNVYHRSCI